MKKIQNEKSEKMKKVSSTGLDWKNKEMSDRSLKRRQQTRGPKKKS